MSDTYNVGAEVRLLPQERPLDAVISLLALEDPDFVNRARAEEHRQGYVPDPQGAAERRSIADPAAASCAFDGRAGVP